LKSKPKSILKKDVKFQGGGAKKGGKGKKTKTTRIKSNIFVPSTNRPNQPYFKCYSLDEH
jgi:hypothetical protein